MTPPDEHWVRHGDASRISKREILRRLVATRDARQAIFIYLVGLALLMGGGLYSLWRISLLDRFMTENRNMAQEQWKIQRQRHEEILRRLSPDKSGRNPGAPGLPER